MVIGDAEELEDALDRAILAAAAVQRIEDDVGTRPQRFDQRGEVARHIDRAHGVAALRQRGGAFLAARQRDLALGRPAAHQHGDALLHDTASLTPGNGRPTRLISQSRTMPEFSKTRRRTSSPRPSRSAAVALPVLMRKLACFSETCAPPRVRPRQPARSVSSQALVPGGVAKVEPPVRARTGWLASRAAWISSMRWPIAAGSPAAPANSAAMKIQSARAPHVR